MDTQSHSTTAPAVSIGSDFIRKLSHRIGDAIDALHTIQSLNEVVNMAAAGSGLTRDATNALQAVTNIIDENIEQLHRHLADIHEEISND